MSSQKVCMAMLSNPDAAEKKDQQQVLFAFTREEVVKKAYKQWVEADMGEGGWIYSYNQHEGKGTWIPYLKELVAQGKYEEAVREVWGGSCDVWFEIFEGEM